MRAGAVVVVMLAFMLAGCADGDTEEAGMNLREARARAEAQVEATIEAFGGDVSVIEREEPIEASCHGESGAPADTLSTSVAVQLDLGGTDMTQSLRTIQAHWQEEGMEVRSQNLDSDLPALIAEADGFEYAVQGARERNHIRLIGTTPCLPEEDSVFG